VIKLKYKTLREGIHLDEPIFTEEIMALLCALRKQPEKMAQVMAILLDQEEDAA
jgi:hypothetical protein